MMSIEATVREMFLYVNVTLRLQKKYSCHENGHLTVGHSTYILCLLALCNFNEKVRRSLPRNEDS